MLENNKKLKRINNIKIITFWVICALVALFFKFSMVTPTYAYYLDNNGNIQSNNLYNKDTNIATNQLISHENGNVFYNFEGYYISDYISVDSNSYYSCNNWNSYYCWWYDTNKNPISVLPSNVTTALSPNNAKYLRLSSNDIDDLMLNKGQTILTYEPFGVWIKSSDLDNVYPFMSNDWQFVRGQLNGYSLNEIDEVIEFKNSFINIIPRYLEDYNGYNSNYDNSLSVEFKSNKISSFGSYKAVSQFSGALDDYYNLTFKNGNDVVLTTINFNTDSAEGLGVVDFTYPIEFDSIIIDVKTSQFYSTDYINYFSANVGTFIQGYNYGYNEGNTQGLTQGYNNGYSVGNIDGYNRGYNEGIQQDIESTGFKTLITTILSYPVNMVRESLNFEFMGIHVASIVLFIVSLGIVAFVIKRFKD